MRFSWRGTRLIVSLLLLAAAAAANTTASSLSISPASDAPALARTLQSKNATEAAAAAYWLGLKGPQAVPQIPRLVEALADNRSVRPWAYRRDLPAAARTTPGEEAAGALARIGRPAVDPLIRALRTSSSSFARQNAAWALGQIDSGERGSSASAPRPQRDRQD